MVICIKRELRLNIELRRKNRTLINYYYYYYYNRPVAMLFSTEEYIVIGL